MLIRLCLVGLACACVLPLAAVRSYGQDEGWTPEKNPAGNGAGHPDDDEVQRILHDALGEGPLEVRAELRPRLVEHLTSPDWYTRRNAVCALRRAGADECLEPILEALLREPEPLVIEEMIQAMGGFGAAAVPRIRTRLAAAPAGDARTRLLVCALAAGDADERLIAELAQALRANPRAPFQRQGQAALARTTTWAGAEALIDLARSLGTFDALWLLADLREPRLDEALLGLLSSTDPVAIRAALGLLIQRDASIPQETLLHLAHAVDPAAEGAEAVALGLAVVGAISRHPFPAGIEVLLRFAFRGRGALAEHASKALLECWSASAAPVLAVIEPRAPGWRSPIEVRLPGDSLSFGDSRVTGIEPFTERATERAYILKHGCFALTVKEGSHVWMTAILPTAMARTAALLDGATSFADLVREAGWDANGRESFGRFCLTLHANGMIVWDAPQAGWGAAKPASCIPEAPDDCRLTAMPAVFHGFWGE